MAGTVSITAFARCPDSGVEPGRWFTDLSCGVSLTPRLHSDPAQGADPASGAERTSSSKKFILLHMEKCHTLRGGGGGGADPVFCLYTHTQKKKRCQTLHAGSNPTNLEEHKIGGSDPAIGAGDLRLH